MESLSERILSDLSSTFKRDPNIFEFDIIPVEDSLCNKSPVIHVDHRLALESWCVKHVYKYVYAKFMSHKCNPSSSTRPSNELIQEWTRALLLINPDLTVAWNARRELSASGFITPLSELKFSEIVLSRKPKAPENFFYREWLWKLMLRSDATTNKDLITDELRVTLDAASRYHRNYYAWSHRVWIFNHLCSDQCLDILHCDFVVTKSWSETHISDYSCFQYRQFLLNYFHDRFIRDESNSNENLMKSGLTNGINNLLVNELDMLNSLSNLYSDQESLFMHRRFILYCLSKWFATESEEMRSNELTFIDEQLSKSYSICKLNQWQLELIRRHVNYLKRVLKWDCESV